jgi:hypothetical protein
MIKKVIEIDVDQVQAMGGLDALQQSLVETETKSQSLKAELRKLKQQLAELPEGSEEYNKIAQRAGEVSDQIGDINTRIRNLGSDTKNIDAVVEGAQALSGAFSVATSASALFGEENKELQETMLKVESAIGLTVGIQSIANALQKETALSIGLANVATKIQIGLQTAYATVVGTTTGALKALRVALLSTGVGALVVALGFLVSKLTESTEATEDQEEALKNLTDAQKAFNESLKSEIDGIQNSTQLRILRAKVAGKSEKELREIEKKGEQERAQAIDAEIKRVDKELQNRKLSAEQFKFLQEERNKLSEQSLKLAQERDVRQLEFEADIADQRRDAEAKAREEAKRKAKERAEELKRIEKEKYEALLKEANDFFAKAKESQEAYDKDFAENFKRQQDELDKIQTPEDKALNETNRQLAEIDNFNGTLGEKKRLLEEYNSFVSQQEFLTDEEKAYYEKQGLERKKILQQQELALTAQTFGKIAEIAGRNSKIGKAFAVGQALINTYQGITAELQTKAVTPYEIGLKVANIAFVASTGFKAVKQILATNPMSSGGGSASSASVGGGGASATPQFNLVGQSSTNQLTATIAGQQNQPIQTYVVGSQVTSQQALDRNAVANSVFG